MRFGHYFFASFALAVSLTAAAQGGEKPGIERFHPRLTLNNDAALCRPFLQSWQEIFDGVAPLSEDQLNLSASYPKGEVWVFPPEGRGGLYNSSYSQTVDFDGDGEPEVLYLESNDVGWRYLGASLYLFDSEKDYRIALASKAHQRPWGLSLAWSDKPIPASFGKIANYPPTAVVQILRLNGKFYTVMPPQGPRENEGRETSLVQLDAKGQPKAVCSVELFPPKKRFAAFRDRSALFQNLKDVYGVPEQTGCLGTMGWTAPPVDSLLPTLFYRPHLLAGRNRSPQSPSATAKEDSAREIRFLVWGLSDPQSWRDYLGVKNGRDAFLDEMHRHYMAQFSYSSGESRSLAERAWRALLDRVVYARNSGGYTLVAGMSGELPVGPDSTPEEVARAALEVWQDQFPAGPDFFVRFGKYGRAAMAQQALLAAVYTGQPLETIERNLVTLNAILDRIQEYEENPEMRRRLEEMQQRSIDLAFLAALNDKKLADYFLTKGADPNALTNLFGKTPLMYAAQQNQFGAASYLLDRGADVNISTRMGSVAERYGFGFGYGSPYGCSRLKRDSRTALMYAAENASAKLIRLIVEAGADISATDSRGNTALWYFNRNTLVTGPSRKAVERSLSH